LFIAHSLLDHALLLTLGLELLLILVDQAQLVALELKVEVRDLALADRRQLVDRRERLLDSLNPARETVPMSAW
jgi:hypothetical protein